MINFFLKYKKTLSDGFTLLELLVSTSVFATVAIVGISIIFASQTTYKKIAQTSKVVDNLHIVMETMGREIKFGTRYACLIKDGSNFKDSTYYNNFVFPANGDTDSNDNCNNIAFIPQDKSASSTVFYFNFDSSSGGINRIDYFCPLSGICSIKKDYPMTASGLNLDTFRVKVSGSGIVPVDYFQPSVSLFLSGIIMANTNNTSKTFNLQSFISQRIIDR